MLSCRVALRLILESHPGVDDRSRSFLQLAKRAKPEAIRDHGRDLQTPKMPSVVDAQFVEIMVMAQAAGETYRSV